jgi:serine/threonine protein kinase
MNTGDRVGDYELATLLGQGLTGSTWAGLRLEGGAADEKVVLKILDLGAAKGWGGVELFRREAEVLKHLDHPGIPRYIDYFESESQGGLLMVLVTEYVDGENLQTAASGSRRFTDPEIESILADLAEVLAYLGSLRPPIVHRDVNPKNIVQRPWGGIALVDFSGVQEALRLAGNPGSTLVGTAGYTPVEQVAGRANPKSDLYGAACTALFLLTKRNPAELPARGLKTDLDVLPTLSPRLRYVLDSWLEPDEAERRVTASEAADILRGAPLPAAPATPARRRDGRKVVVKIDTAQERPAPLPSDSRVTIDEREDTFRLRIPPAGLRGPQPIALGGFSLFWLAFVALWTFMAVSMGAPIFFSLFSIPFWAVGLFMLKIALAPVFGSTELSLGRDGVLLFVESFLFIKRRRSWPIWDLGGCNVQKSSVQMRGSAYRELVLEAGAQKLRFGRGLSDRELRAMERSISGAIRRLSKERKSFPVGPSNLADEGVELVSDPEKFPQ